MKEEKFSSSVRSATALDEPTSSKLADDSLQQRWQDVVKRRSFLKGVSLVGATLAAGTLMGKDLTAQTARSSRRLSKGDDPTALRQRTGRSNPTIYRQLIQILNP